MGYLVAVIITFIGFKSKRSKVVTGLIAVYLWALIGLNTYTADFAAYEEMYLFAFENRYALHEPGYMLLCKICLILGLTYRQFRMLLGIGIVFLLIKGLHRFSKYINPSLSLFLIFPFVGLVSGLRNATCISIIIYNSHYLFSDKRGTGIKYAIGVVIAMMFHYSAIFYFLLLIVKIKKISINVIVCALIATVAVAFWALKTGVLYQIVKFFIKSEKVLSWVNYQGGFSVLYIIAMMLYLSMIFILYRMLMISKIREKIVIENMMNSKNIRTIIKIALISMLGFAGGFLRSVVFLRLVIALLPIMYVVFSDVLTSRCIDSYDMKKELLLWKIILLMLCCFVTVFVYEYWIGGDMLQVYQNNLLFSWK